MSGLAILVCRKHLDETSAVIDREEWKDVAVAAYPVCSDRHGGDTAAICRAIEGLDRGGRRVEVVGGSCLRGCREFAASRENVNLREYDPCQSLFIGGTFVEQAVAKGAHLLVPGDLSRWKGELEKEGFDRQTAGKMYRESTSRFILLDTGVAAGVEKSLAELSRYLEIPCETISSGLDFYGQLLTNVYLGWQIKLKDRDCGSVISSVRRESSEYAMMVDLITDLASMKSEREVTQAILDMAAKLFSPARMAYLPMINGHDGTLMSVPPDRGTPGQESAAPLATMRKKPYEETDKGFRVRIDYFGEPLGALEVEEFTFPEYRNHYMNLAASMSRIFGLAIANARSYQTVIESKKRLEKTEEEYRALYENAPLGYQSLDEEGNIVSVNKAWLKMLGYTRGEVSGTFFGDFLAAESRKDFLERFPRFRISGRARNSEFVMRRKDESTVLVAINGRAVRDEKGRFLRSHCILNNITEQRRTHDVLFRAHEVMERRVAERTQELSKANARLRELDSLKSMFVASVSHELRTPLNAIVGFTGVILQGMTGEINAEQQKQLSLVKENAEHLKSLINDVIDVSRVESGQIVPSFDQFDLTALGREVMSSFGERGDGKGPDLFLDAGEAIIVRSDKRRVKQVILNLVSNAVKFTDEGTVSMVIEKQGAGGAVSIRDTGVGIREEDMAGLFQPFTRIAHEHRPAKEGTGLGLYLSEKIAEMLGGRITVSSRIGEGSVFKFEFPAR